MSHRKISENTSHPRESFGGQTGKEEQNELRRSAKANRRCGAVPELSANLSSVTFCHAGQQTGNESQTARNNNVNTRKAEPMIHPLHPVLLPPCAQPPFQRASPETSSPAMPCAAAGIPRHRSGGLRILAASVITALAAATSLHAQLTDMGTLGGDPGDSRSHSSRPFGINSANQVVGGSIRFRGNENRHGFLWDTTNVTRDLGTLGGSYSIAYAINDAGQAVGESFTAARGVSAVLWDSTGAHGIDTLNSGASWASAINRNGQVVGTVLNPARGEYDAFIWDSVNGMRDIGTLGGGQCSATAINSRGQVTGWSYLPGSSDQHAFLWDSTNGMRDLGTLPGYDTSDAVGISDAGQVVGTCYSYATGELRVFVWDATRGMQEISPGRYSIAKAINNSGQVIFYGFTDDQTAYHSFIWDSRRGVRDLGTLGRDNFPEAINNAGQVVGSFYTTERTQHAYVWGETNGMQDLGTLGGNMSIAWCISDTGGITGQSTTDTGEFHGFFVQVAVPPRNDPPEVQILHAGAVIGALTSAQVTTKGNQTALGNFLIQATNDLQKGDVAKAIGKLQEAIGKTDGYALRGAVDVSGPGRDWITDRQAQADVYALLTGAVAALTQ